MIPTFILKNVASKLDFFHSFEPAPNSSNSLDKEFSSLVDSLNSEVSMSNGGRDIQPVRKNYGLEDLRQDQKSPNGEIQPASRSKSVANLEDGREIEQRQNITKDGKENDLGNLPYQLPQLRLNFVDSRYVQDASEFGIHSSGMSTSPTQRESEIYASEVGTKSLSKDLDSYIHTSSTTIFTKNPKNMESAHYGEFENSSQIRFEGKLSGNKEILSIPDTNFSIGDDSEGEIPNVHRGKGLSLSPDVLPQNAPPTLPEEDLISYRVNENMRKPGMIEKELKVGVGSSVSHMREGYDYNSSISKFSHKTPIVEDSLSLYTPESSKVDVRSPLMTIPLYDHISIGGSEVSNLGADKVQNSNFLNSDSVVRILSSEYNINTPPIKPENFNKVLVDGSPSPILAKSQNSTIMGDDLNAETIHINAARHDDDSVVLRLSSHKLNAVEYMIRNRDLLEASLEKSGVEEVEVSFSSSSDTGDSRNSSESLEAIEMGLQHEAQELNHVVNVICDDRIDILV